MKERSILALAALAILAACGGGGGGGSSVGAGSNAVPTVPPATSAPTAANLPAGMGRAQFSITVPGKGSAATARQPKAVAAGTQSIVMTLLQNNGAAASGTPQAFALTSGTPGCSTVGGNLTCTFGVDAPVGTDIFLATTYSSTNQAAGTQLGSGAVQLTVVQNATNTANLTLTGPIQSVVVAANNTNLWNGVGNFFTAAFFTQTLTSAQRQPKVLASPTPFPSSSPTTAPTAVPSARLFVIGQDASQNIILNPAPYNQPVTLTLSLGTVPCPNGSPGPASPGPANVTLSVTPALSGFSAQSTSVDGGTVQVNSPADLVTLAMIPGVPSPMFCFGLGFANFPVVTASLNPPPAGFTPASFPFTVQANPMPGPIVLDQTLIQIGTPQFPLGQYVYVNISEVGYSGPFSVDPSACNGAVTTGQLNNTQFYVYGNSVTPQCSVVVSDSNGQTATLKVSVTTTTVTGQ